MVTGNLGTKRQTETQKSLHLWSEVAFLVSQKPPTAVLPLSLNSFENQIFDSKGALETKCLSFQSLKEFFSFCSHGITLDTSSIFSKKISSFCSSSSRPYFYLFSIFAYKRIGRFYSTYMAAQNNHFRGSKFHRFLILLAQGIKTHFFMPGMDSNIYVFNNIFPIMLGKNSNNIVKNIQYLHIFYAYFNYNMLTIYKNKLDTALNTSTCAI